jgi:hypothetical protein
MREAESSVLIPAMGRTNKTAPLDLSDAVYSFLFQLHMPVMLSITSPAAFRALPAALFEFFPFGAIAIPIAAPVITPIAIPFTNPVFVIISLIPPPRPGCIFMNHRPAQCVGR